MTIFLAMTCCEAMALVGYTVELIFRGGGPASDQQPTSLPTHGVTWNCLTWLDIVFLLLVTAHGRPDHSADDGRLSGQG